jgi:CHASE2 domain-containing sensor protein
MGIFLEWFYNKRWHMFVGFAVVLVSVLLRSHLLLVLGACLMVVPLLVRLIRPTHTLAKTVRARNAAKRQ